jgi:hypothetical protein
LTWLVDGIAGGNSTVGTIVAGLYTAPETPGNHVVTASVVSGSTTVFSSASVLIIAVTAGTAATLTFGTHLTSGGTSYNGSTAVTLTSDATSANTSSTLVARDSSGNFSAGTVTASVVAPTVKLSTLPPVYANNAAALAGGLIAGQIYRTNSDPDFIAVVH